MAPQRVLLFGDQMLDSLPVVRSLVSRSRKSPLVRRFLQEATDVIHVEVGQLQSHEQKQFFEFETLLSLAEQNAALKQPNGFVNTTLMCVARLGYLILFAEKDPSILESPESTLHIGLCTGLLPAAAAVVARDTSHLLQYGLEIVALTFRLIHEVFLRSSRVEKEPGAWSYTVVGVTHDQTQAILDDFNQAENLPRHKHAYVGAFSSAWCTISGPPSVLTRLWSTSTLIGQASRLELPADAAVHSAHLPCLDTDRILASPDWFLTTPINAKVKVLSPSNGEPYTASNLGNLIRAMVQDISHNHMDLVQTFQKAARGIQGVRNVDLMVIGPTAHANPLQAALETNKLKVSVISSLEDIVQHGTARDGSGLIAVVGMSGRFPGSESIQTFWESLQRGQDFHQKIPSSRFDWEKIFDPSCNGKNTISAPFGCFIDKPGMFDYRLFNVSPREAMQMDPHQRLLLMSCYEALEMAGYSPDSPSTLTKRVASYIGQVADDWRCINECRGVDIYYIPGIARSFSAGRLNYHFKWEGPCYNLDSACASSSTAVALACSALLARNCDTAVAGGGSILAAPLEYCGLSKGGFLSPTGGCKTFQESADGYCRGEGIGIVVLKRLEDAIAEHDNIQGVISGWGRTHSARAASMTQPHAETQSYLIKKVLDQACISPHDVGYVEMHGTGTTVGDKAEMESVLDVFAEGRQKDNPLTLGAVKANVGHGEGASGVTSLIKTIMMLRESSIPPQPGAPFKINPNFPPLSPMHVRIADQNMPFEPPLGGDGKRRLLLNNFDASGGNTCLIIEDPPPRQAREGRDPRLYHIVVCSARTSKSLLENQCRLYEFIKSHPQTKLSDLSYTTTARRLHHVVRRSYYTKTLDDLEQQLGAELAKSPTSLAEPPKTTPSVVFTFTGQGSAYSGMGKQLFESCSRFRNSLFSYQRSCDSLDLPQVLDIFTDPKIDFSTKSTVQIQLAITFLEIALADLLISWGIRPSLLIGHSLGEYAALCISGVLSVTDTLYLVGKRSLLLQDRCKSGAYAMLAVGASVEQLEPFLSNGQFQSCQVACINSPKRTVVSGPVENLRGFRDRLESEKIRTTFLEITYGFHSSQVDPILHDFESSAKAVHFSHPAIPVASTLMAGTIVKEKGIFTPAYLARQAREPVNFAGTLQACAGAKLVNPNTNWFEIGPESINLSLIRDTLNVPSKFLLPVLKSNEDNWRTISQAVSVAYTSSVTVNWMEYHKEYSNLLSLLELPSYAFDLKEYWAPYTGTPTCNTSLEAKSPAKPTSETSDLFVPSATLQNLQQSVQSAEGISAIFSSALSEPNLLAAVKGHMVDGTALCPASVFCDMAYAATKYVFARSNSGQVLPTMVLEDLEVTHPLIAGKDVDRIAAEVHASSAHGSGLVKVSFSSKKTGSSTTHTHGSCVVRLVETTRVRASYQDSANKAREKLDSLITSARTGQKIRLPKPIVYKLFANLVDYGAAYQCMDEVYLENGPKDGAASVRLGNNLSTGNFACNPYWADAVIHLAGFVLNGDMTKPDDIVYIATGCKELTFLEPLKPNTEYLVSASIKDEDKGNCLAQVFVFQDQRLAVVCTGIIYQKMTKRVLGVVMGKAGLSSKSGTPEHSTGSKPSTSKPSASPVASSVGHASAAKTNKSEGNASQITQDLLAAVASETGYSIDDMQPSDSFADMGVDSLMSIAIVSAVKRTSGVELPAAFFQEHPTVADVVNDFKHTAADGVSEVEPSMAEEVNETTIAEEAPTDDFSQIAQSLLAAVASETGYSIDDMQPSDSFADMGVDSLMSIAIVSAIKRTNDVELPATFFQENPTVADVTNRFAATDETSSSESASKSTRHDDDDQAQSSNTSVLSDKLDGQPKANDDHDFEPATVDPPLEKPKPEPIDLSMFSSQAILIAGRATSKATPLFLIADGAGSAAAYIHLPRFPSGGKIYALESPFLHDPPKFTCSVEEVSSIYLRAIRTAQPEGPYILGGWSAGAALAYETARQLLDQGETVQGLILIDMRVPKPIPDEIELTIELIEDSGLVTGLTRAGQAISQVSRSTKQHLLQTVTALRVYQPVPLDPARRPKHTTLIWAKQGLKEREGFGGQEESDMTVEDSPYFGNIMEDPNTGLKSWFYAKRTNFGPNGWDKLVGDVDIHTIDGDHFSIVVPPEAKVLGQLLQGAMEKAEAKRS